MSQKKKGWNSFAYLVDLARKKEPVIIHFDQGGKYDPLKGIIVEVDNYTLAFLTKDGRELLIYKHAVRFIEKVKVK